MIKIYKIKYNEQLLKPGMTVVDLGAAPGGWTQYVSRKLNGRGKIIALDILPMDALPDVECILGDFREDAVLEQLMRVVPERGVDLLLSDMAPNMSGVPSVDILRAMELAELCVDFANAMLKPGGAMLIKLFHGAGFDTLVKQIRLKFEHVSVKKPKASRPRSRETYLLAKGYLL